MCEHSGLIIVWLIRVIVAVVPDIIDFRLCTVSHNTLITLTSSCKESSVYCAVISILYFCVVSSRICKLTKHRETGFWYCMTLNINCGSCSSVPYCVVILCPLHFNKEMPYIIHSWKLCKWLKSVRSALHVIFLSFCPKFNLMGLPGLIPNSCNVSFILYRWFSATFNYNLPPIN